MSGCSTKWHSEVLRIEQLVDALNSRPALKSAPQNSPTQQLQKHAVQNPPRMRVRLRFTSSALEDPATKEKRERTASNKISFDELEELQAAETSVLEWLDAHPDNPVQFAREPVEALAKAAPDLSDELLRRLARHRSMHDASSAPSDVRLEDVQVTVTEVDCA